MRLNRFLASAGLGSRRSVEELITDGKVRVNGKICVDLATKVSETDEVFVGGKRVQADEKMYLLLNKPRGFLCTAKDEPGEARPTIFQLLPAGWPRVSHAGRLDFDSEGLLLLTNDGDFALRMTHPRYKVDKEYVVTLDRPFESGDTAALLKGIFIAPDDETKYLPARERREAEPAAAPPERVRAKAESVVPMQGNSVRVVLRQGLKRQIRLMFLALSYKVRRLVRVRIGPLSDRTLASGSFRKLTPREVKTLLKASEEITARPPVRRSAGAKSTKPANARPSSRGAGARKPGSRNSGPRRGPTGTRSKDR